MYTPKSMSKIPLIVLVVGSILFLIPSLSIVKDITINSISLGTGTIVDYSSSPSVKFIYNKEEFIIKSKSSTSCNNKPCNEIGAKKHILIDKANPNNSIFLGDLLSSLIFFILLSLYPIGYLYFYKKDIERLKVIKGMQDRNEYTIGTIISKIPVYSKSSKTKKSYIVGYKYLCLDLKTKKEYYSDQVEKDIFKVGSMVNIYIDHQNINIYPEIFKKLYSFYLKREYPGIYWVDLNTVRDNKESVDKIESVLEEKVKDNVKNSNLIVMGPISGFILILVIDIFFIGFAYIIGDKFFLIWLFPIVLTWSLFMSFGRIIKDIKSNKIKSKGLSYTGIIEKIEKVGKFKNIPSGYIPFDEKDNVKLGMDLDELGLYGYAYKFHILIHGKLIESDTFVSPFPKKATIGAKIEVYFKDYNYTEYTTDLKSIDNLN